MGVAIKPQVLRKIENNRGEVIEVFQPTVDKVFPVEAVARLVSVMQDVVKYGTGTGAKLDDRPVAGKTGTADEAKDIWFVGFTPDMVTAIWGGNDENLSIEGKHVTGGDVMAKIWKDYTKAYYILHPTPPGSFVPPTAPTDEEKKLVEKTESKLNSKVVKSDTVAAPTPTKDADGTPGEKPASPAANQTPVEVTKVESAPSAQTEIKPAPSADEKAPVPAPERSINPTPAPAIAPTPAPTPVSAPVPAPNAVPSPAPALSPKSMAPAAQPALGLKSMAASNRSALISMPADALDSVKRERPTRLYPYNPPALKSKYLPAPAPQPAFQPLLDGNHN
jgi:membrane peptidoglycan carboxypeptidase